MPRRERKLHTMFDELPARGRCSEHRAMAYRLALGVVLPQLLYYAGVRLRLAAPAIVAVVTWTAVLAIYDLRRSSVDPFMLYAVAVTVSQGAAALLIRDPLVFAAGSVVENLLDGLGFLASVAAGRPLAAVAMSALGRLSGGPLLPAAMDRALRRLTLLWAWLFLLRGATLYAALIHLSLGSFLIVSTVTGWPINAAGAAASLAYLGRAQGRKPEPTVASVAHRRRLGAPRVWVDEAVPACENAQCDVSNMEQAPISEKQAG